MTNRTAEIAGFLSQEPDAIVCELTGVQGSSPREQGTFMLVGKTSLFGTIGGGALEYMVIDHARRLISSGRAAEQMHVPLGPEIGQCCGGRVDVSLRRADADSRSRLSAIVAKEDAMLPQVFVFGAGHVGRVLAQMLMLLPLHVEVIDTRGEEIEQLAPGIIGRAVAMPEAIVRSAPPGSSYVIMTHDHTLDFLIAREALRRLDAPYIGMVGSDTKRGKFSNWFRREGGDVSALRRLVLPIGRQGLGDKRPEIIAVHAASEIMAAVSSAQRSGRALPLPVGERAGVRGHRLIDSAKALTRIAAPSDLSPAGRGDRT